MSNNKKYVSLARLSNFLENIKSKYSQIGHKHTIADLSDYRVDTALSSTSNNPVQNKVLDAEFDAMATAMSALELAIDGKANSTHNHNDLYYTETEVDEKLASKADSSHYHSNYVPTSRTVNGKALSSNISLSASDVGALPNTTSIPDALSDLSSDSTHRTVTDAEKAAWNAKSNFSGSYNDLANKPTIPSISGLATETYVNDVANNKVDKVSGKGLSTNDYTTAEKNKLSGIASGAEVNQNAFSNVVVGTTTIVADSKTDSLTIAAGDGVSVSGDATNDEITITNSGVRSISTGSSNGTISVNTNGTSANVAVKGLGSAAYKATSAFDAAGSADASLASAKSYTDTKVSGLASTTVVDNKVSSHNTSTSSHSDIRDLITGLTTRLNTLANSDDTTLDQMSEVVAYIKNNKNLIDGITTNKVNVSDIVNNLTTNVSNKPLSAAQGVAIKNLIDALQEELDSHGHAISDVSGLQSALDGKAASSHGTHVSYSTTAPVMDGTASVGSASTVARSDHKHPIDTSRASKTEFDTHTSDTTKHITSAERTNWNDAKIKIDGVEAGAKVNVQSDWNVNDASSDAYVKNRPFWSDDPVETLLVDSVTFNTQAYGDIAYAGNPFSLELIEGVTYDVIWNGTKYTSVCVSLSGVPALGNASILGMGANTNEPFLINYANGNYVYTSSPVSVTIKVVGHISEIHKIDNKYIDFPNFPEGSYVGAFGQNSGEIFNDYQGNTASGALSHAEGGETTASGNFSHAEGAYTTASGHWSHAEGYHSTASVRFSHAEGYGTNAAADAQHVQGKFNVIDTDGKYAHIVGNGTSDSNRVNIHTVDWYGNAWFDGNVYVGGTSQDDASKVITEADKELLLPKATASDNGKVLRVVDGAWAADESGGAGGGNSSNNNVTLTVAGWDNENEQTVNVEGVTATNTIIVGGDIGSEPHYTDCEVYCSGQGNGTLTFKCTLPPSEDLIANVAIL